MKLTKQQQDELLDYTIVIDTREQLALWKPNKKHIVSGLKTGDYSLLGFEDKIAIERKSPMDAISTITHGHDRFKRELERSKELEYFAIVIECSYSDLLHKKFDNSFRTKVKGHVACSILNTIHIKYNIPIFYTTGRTESQTLIRGLFTAYIKNKLNQLDECEQNE